MTLFGYLEPLVQQTNEPALRSLLDQARTQQRELAEKATTTAQQLEPILQVEGFEQVLAYLETLPPHLHASPALQSARTRAQEGLERERAHVAFLGQSYAALSSNNPPADWTGTEAVATTGVMGEMTRALERRRLGNGDPHHHPPRSNSSAPSCWRATFTRSKRC